MFSLSNREMLSVTIMKGVGMASRVSVGDFVMAIAG
jgi:hypothetical protein